ncbi:hypothetical protein AB0530_000851 [Vibrio parahaemolyticus]
MKYDVIILGAGLAGITIANKLQSIGMTVLVLEKGDKLEYTSSDPSTDKLASVSTYAFGQGGTTNLWHSGLIYPRIDDIKNKELQSKYHELKEFIPEALNILGGYYNPFELKRGKSQLTFETNDIFYPDTHKPLVINDGVDAFYGIKVEKISPNDKEISFIDENKSLKVFGYNKLVLCCGGLNTPRVLKELFDINFTGFNDHPMGFVGKVKVKKEYIPEFCNIQSRKVKGGHVKTALLIKDKDMTSCFYLRPAASLTMNDKISKYKSLLGASTGLSLIKNMFDIRIFHPDIISEIIFKIFGRVLSKRHYSVLFIGEQFDNESALTTNYAELKISKDHIAKYREHICEFFKQISIYCESVSYNKEVSRSELWSAAHYSSSASLGLVVDSNYQLQNYKDVYVCDTSIIPDHGYYNTGLFITTICLQFCEQLRDS